MFVRVLVHLWLTADVQCSALLIVSVEEIAAEKTQIRHFAKSGHYPNSIELDAKTHYSSIHMYCSSDYVLISS